MKTYTLLLSLLVFFTISCSSNDSEKATRSPVEEVAEDVDVNKFENLIGGSKVILDVRTPGEYADGHIEGAQLINVSAPDFDKKIEKLDKTNTSYLVYCAAGSRSQRAMQKMKTAGFKSVYNLSTGVNGWKAAGKKLVK